MAKKKIPAFTNEEYKNYSQPRERKAMEAALKKAADTLGKRYPLVIGEERIGTTDSIASRNPAHPDEVIERSSTRRKHFRRHRKHLRRGAGLRSKSG
jgi:1-pyrroline-5-carboxylate dehydrogenase